MDYCLKEKDKMVNQQYILCLVILSSDPKHAKMLLLQGFEYLVRSLDFRYNDDDEDVRDKLYFILQFSYKAVEINASEVFMALLDPLM